jgi:UDP-glucose 4-epimerase
MKLLVIGAAGFIGSHLSDALLMRRHSVVAVDDLSKGTLENLAHNTSSPMFAFHKMDARDTARLTELASGCDVVVDLAARKIPRYGSSLDCVATNFDVARASLDAAHAAGAKCVLASTSDVYGKSKALPFREDGNCLIGPSTSRRWAYAASKLAIEHLALGYQEEYGLPVTILRFFGTYGERQYMDWWGGPQGVFMTAILEGRPMEVHGDGRQTRCFIHVSDLVQGIAVACEREAANGEILNLGTTEEVSICELAELMHELSGTGGGPAQVELIPYESFGGSYEDVQRRVPDMTKSRALLDFEPTVPLREGVRRLWDWYRAEQARAARQPAQIAS